MSETLTPYLQRIWNYLVRRYQLRIQRDTAELRVLSRERAGERIGGARNFTIQLERYVLTYHKKLDYLEFKTPAVTRRFRHGKAVGETVDGDWPDFTVNGTGSIRRMYGRQRGTYRWVRTISLTNYYQLGDDCLARLIMVTNNDLAWINELPVAFHPLSNKELPPIKSIDDLFAHFTGPGIEIPKRLRHAMPVNELFILVRIVPGNYLNAMAAMLKHVATDPCDPGRANRLIYHYYRSVLEDGKTLHFQTAYSYVAGCRALGKQINPRIRSLERLETEQRAMVDVRHFEQMPDLRVSDKFILKRTDFGDVQFELIKDRKRLWRESRDMENCVHTYGYSIIDGTCAIYHVTYRGKGYTLELQETMKGRLYARQLLGGGNGEAPRALCRRMRAILQRAKRQRSRDLAGP